MRKNVFGRQLKRDKNERAALFKGLMSSFVLNDRIKTTEEKAKSIRGRIEKLVTKAKIGGTQVTRLLEPYLTPLAIKKLISIAPRFKERPGGYTRLIKLGRRFNDNASVVIMEWVDTSESIVQNLELEADNKEEKTIKKESEKKEKEKKQNKTSKIEKKETKKKESKK